MQDKLLGEIENQKSLTQESIKYLSSTDNPTYQAHLMHENKTFYKFESLNDNNTLSSYHQYYDKPANQQSEYESIRAYREEYFVMADFIDYAVKTSQVFYFKTIEEVLDAARVIPNNLYDNMISQYNITKCSLLQFVLKFTKKDFY